MRRPARRTTDRRVARVARDALIAMRQVAADAGK